MPGARPRDGSLKLHLGCAGTVAPGWENIDKSPSVFLARVPRLRRALRRARILTDEQAAGFPKGIVHADVSRRIPYPDESASYVYTSHMIEHLSRWQALELVRECRRVLAPGGIVRIATPDLREMARSYLEDDFLAELGPTPADAFMTELGTYAEPPDNVVRRLIKRLFSASAHQWLYDARSLSHLLGEGGLGDPRVCRYREGSVPDLELLEHRPRSLFVEARRE